MNSRFDQFNNKIELHSKVLVMPKEKSSKAYIGLVTSFSPSYIYVTCLTNTPNYPIVNRVSEKRIVVLEPLNSETINNKLRNMLEISNN